MLHRGREAGAKSAHLRCMSKDDLLKIEEAPAPLRPVRERNAAAPRRPAPATTESTPRRFPGRWPRRVTRLEKSLRDAVSDDELLVMASITHQRPPAPGASSKSTFLQRAADRPIRHCPGDQRPVVESEARSAIRAASGLVRHDIACSTDGRLPMRS